jgi:FtsP/CotA-like multicopper oxidase with cupredoxin domain
MALYKIPLSSEAQKFSISLAGVTYRLRLRWNSNNSTWTLDIADFTGVPILQGIPLVIGTNLLAPYPYLDFGGKLMVANDDGSPTPPNYSALGVTGQLYFEVL